METGVRLGPYEIVSLIGAGGMGEVWRARDTRLGRDVAIKMLPAGFDARLKIRLEREAKTISRLAHPNICTLFDVGDGYIVMELVEGEPLSRRIARGPLLLNQVIRHGIEIAEALGKAHREGIVHRDVKPGNVMLTKSGAKLLDFGIAKSMSSVPSDDTATEQQLTGEGQVVGTFQYMAPEQIAGEEPDVRSDIFALGAVLYEMATGKRAFEGKSRTDLIAVITRGEPRPIRQFQPMTPPALEHVILKCLEKEADDRWQNATDIAAELRWISEEGSKAGVPAPVIARRRVREGVAWLVAAAALVVATAAGWMYVRARTVSSPAIESAILLKGASGTDMYAGPPAFSPDGTSLAYAAGDKNGSRLLWIRELSDSTARALPNTEGATVPFWSPDGKFIAFMSNGTLRKVPAVGGNVEVIASAPLARGGTWNRDGTIVFSGGWTPLYRVSAGGGEATAVIDRDALGAGRVGWPLFLPDGQRFLFHATGGTLTDQKKAGIWVARLDGTEKPRFITRSDSNAAYIEPGWLLFSREGVLHAQRFDERTARVLGEPMVIAPVQRVQWSDCAVFSASNSGLLAYQRQGSNENSELRLISRKGEVLKTFGRGYFWWPRISNDGSQIAVDVSENNGTGHIWTIRMSDGFKSRYTFGLENESSPAWAPDGKTIAYRVGLAEAFMMTKQANRPATTLVDVPGSLDWPTDWSSDGRYIAVSVYRDTSGGDVVVYSIDDGKIINVAATAARGESSGVFSPDARWIAYASDESGRSEVYVQPFPPTGTKYQISNGGRWPRWRFANEIVFGDDEGRLNTVRVNTASTFAAGPPQPLPVTFSSPAGSSYTNYDLAPDGTILVNDVIHESPPPFTLLANWPGRLVANAKN